MKNELKYFHAIKNRHWLLLAWITTILTGCNSTKQPFLSTELKFQTVGRIPVITGSINGKRAYFIIDTGASISMVNESEANHFGFTCFTMAAQNVVGFGGECRTSEAFNCKVAFGPLVIKGITFRTRPMGDFVNVIQQHENISIAGIIGADVLNRYKIAIDFSNNTLSFQINRKVAVYGMMHHELP
jgi:hypothetical protein